MYSLSHLIRGLIVNGALRANIKKRKKNQMKKKSDPRHKKRIEVVKALFEKIFRPDSKSIKNPVAAQVAAKEKQIDTLITKYAPTWPINQIAPIDLAILRLAIWELLFKKPKDPYKVTIDEAVEIAKQYGTKTSGSFINGVLGSIVKSKVKVKSPRPRQATRPRPDEVGKRGGQSQKSN